MKCVKCEDEIGRWTRVCHNCGKAWPGGNPLTDVSMIFAAGLTLVIFLAGALKCK